METVLQDLRFALRHMRRRPGFTLAAIVTMALGIGANTAVFSVVHSLLYRPLPVPAADELVVVATLEEEFPFPLNVSYPEYRELRQLPVFAGAAATDVSVVQVGAADRAADRVFALFVTGNYFDLLGVIPSLGRGFDASESETPGRSDVVVLSHAYWQGRLAADPSVVGRTLRVNGKPFTVIGVAPESFPGTSGVVRAQLYAPVGAAMALDPPAGPDTPHPFEDRESFRYQVVARLAPGQSLEQARAAVAVLWQRLAREHPTTSGGRRGVVYPEPMTRLEVAAAVYLPQIAAIFMVLVGLVLLIACANVANLLLSQAAGRSKEIAIRAALGSGRLRLIRQLLTESLLLSLAGALGGLVIALWVSRVLATLPVATDLPLHFPIGLDMTVFGYALAVAAGTGIVTGLAPALQASRRSLVEALKEGGRGSGGGRQRLRGLLVVSQVAVSLVLLISAALFLRSLRHFGAMDLGFRTENRVMLTTQTDLMGYDEEKGGAFHRELLRRVRALPGVVRASAAATVPIGFGNSGARIYPEGLEQRPEESNRLVLFNAVDTDYFEVMGTPILQGRPFTEEDTGDSRRVVVVNEVLAERLWPGQDPLGKRLSMDEPDGPFREVVGVARLSRYNLPGESPQDFFYVPFSQSYRGSRVLHVQTEGDPRALMPRLRSEVAALDPQIPVYDLRTMETHVREGKGALLYRLGGGLVGSFGLIGIVLACVGLYAVMAYTVAQRVHELGVRMALGASSGRILAMVLSHGLGLTLAGVALGLVGALALTRSFAPLLVGVTATDPGTFAGVALLLTGVGALAAWLPARRATRVDPLVALRSE